MAVIEFAVISLKNQASPMDPTVVKVLRDCLEAAGKAGGASAFRWLRSKSLLHQSPETGPSGEEDEPLALFGTWHTVEQHTEFLHSGAAARLLANLAPYIRLREVLHIVPDSVSSSADLEALNSGTTMVTSVVEVKPERLDDWLAFVDSNRHPIGEQVAISGRKHKSEGTTKAQVHVREGLGQEIPSELRESREECIYGFFSVQKDANIMPRLATAVEEKGFTDRIEVREWENFITL